MSLDLNWLVKDWSHEPGSIKVRKIMGLDGREKLQLRIDLGLLQMEMEGRPDGQRPHNCESLLAYHQRRAQRAGERGETYQLSPEQRELQQEGIQYSSLSHLFRSTISGRHSRYATQPELFTLSPRITIGTTSSDFQQFRPYVS